MDKNVGRKRMSGHPVLLSGALVAVAAVTVCLCYGKKSAVWEESSQVLDNPYIGFAAKADFIPEAEKNSLVYVEITWREWEPDRGVFNYQQIVKDNYLDIWREQGKKIVLRFVCDVPGEKNYLDIPNWLYLETSEGGTYYDGPYGQGFSPDYENKFLIECHREAIRALGSCFSQDSMLAYVEVGSLGHWGEWHTSGSADIPPMPADEICQQYVDAYTESFPKTCLLMRRPYEIARKAGLGVYNDMTGSKEDTKEWLKWIEAGDEENVPKVTAIPKIWEHAPVGGEFTSSIPMENMLGENMEQTLQLIRASHMSFLGPKCPRAGYEVTREAIDQVKKELGYRFYIPKAELSGFLWSSKCRLKLQIENTGNAPFYYQWPLVARLVDLEGCVLEEKKLLKSVASVGYESPKEIDVRVPKSWRQKNTRIEIAILDPASGEPGVKFAQENGGENIVIL